MIFKTKNSWGGLDPYEFEEMHPVEEEMNTAIELKRLLKPQEAMAPSQNYEPIDPQWILNPQ